MSLVLVVLALVMMLTSSPTPTTSAASNFKAGINAPGKPVQTLWRGLDRCSVTTTAWAWEIGKSGTTRLRIKYLLKSPNDPGFLPSYSASDWVSTIEFADDAIGHWFAVTLGPGTFNFYNGQQYAIWGVFIGERPSFWKPDLRIKRRLGIATCEIDDPTAVPPPGGPGTVVGSNGEPYQIIAS